MYDALCTCLGVVDLVVLSSHPDADAYEDYRKGEHRLVVDEYVV